MPSHPLNDQIAHAVSLLRERGVLDGVECPCDAWNTEPNYDYCGFCLAGCDHDDDCHCQGTGFVVHPLRPLLVAKDAYEQEAGLCVPCPHHHAANHHGLVCLCGMKRQAGYDDWPSAHTESCDCHGTGYVARSLDGWPESAIVGWLRWLCEQVGWKAHTYFIQDAWFGYIEDIPGFGHPIAHETEAAAALSALVAAIEAWHG